MNVEQIREMVEKQRKFFQSGATIPVKFRVDMLKKLYAAVKLREAEIGEALREDLGKSEYEGFMCETGMALSEISYALKRVRKWTKAKQARTPLAQFPAKSYQKPTPYGNTLIMSPWNYPFLLTIDPLVAAIAAGNTAVVKPSAYAPATGRLIEKMLTECFPREYIAVITGGRAENAALLEQKFDFIFFTGSQSVGKEVLRRAAEDLTPAVLELGGKSPCIVDSSAKIKLAAKRIVFGKFLNCGQTCVAPDYILCEKSVKEELINEIAAQIRKQYGEKPMENPDYGRIVNAKHFERLCGLIDAGKTVFGGGRDATKLKIEPTVLDGVTWQDAVMQEEIFGPILPVLTFENFDEAYGLLKDKPKPLALYLFTEDKRRVREVTEKFSYGGG
ncbi:MAG: aldehyde dehydrogenase family protein, partial [Clostridia bacterium]|nr:aldehyde dehydrogenase family protein [Clostridia bacterium]